MGCAVMRKSYLGLTCTLIYVGFLGAIPVLLAAPLFAVVCYIGFLGYRLYLNSASGLTRRQFFFSAHACIDFRILCDRCSQEWIGF